MPAHTSAAPRKFAVHAAMPTIAAISTTFLDRLPAHARTELYIREPAPALPATNLVTGCIEVVVDFAITPFGLVDRPQLLTADLGAGHGCTAAAMIVLVDDAGALLLAGGDMMVRNMPTMIIVQRDATFTRFERVSARVRACLAWSSAYNRLAAGAAR